MLPAVALGLAFQPDTAMLRRMFVRTAAAAPIPLTFKTGRHCGTICGRGRPPHKQSFVTLCLFPEIGEVSEGFVEHFIAAGSNAGDGGQDFHVGMHACR